MDTATPDRIDSQDQGLHSKFGRTALFIRGAIVLIGLLIGVLILQSQVARGVAKTDPIEAAEIAPGDATILAEAARSMMQGPKANATLASAFAKRALARDPTLTQAIETLALVEAMAGNHSRAERLFTLSSRISRRSLATRIWLIERAIDQGDAEAALAQMDIALRTSTSAPPLIFPALRNGLTDPQLVEPIARLADRPSDWREAFLLDVAANGDPASGAALLLKMRDREFLAAKGFNKAMVGKLIDARRFSLARDIVNAFGRHEASGRLIDGDFSNTEAQYPFGWGLVESSTIGAARSHGAKEPSLSYHADEGKSGQVAVQLVMLPPGRYRLSSVTAQIGDPAPFWHLACGEEGDRKLVRFDAAAGNGSRVTREFDVPPGCQAQWLTLNLRPSLDGEQSGTIASVAIEEL